MNWKDDLYKLNDISCKIFNSERLDLEDARSHIVSSRYTSAARRVFDGSDGAVLYRR